MSDPTKRDWSVELLAGTSLLFATIGCEPYGTFNKNGDESLGPVDPVTFPAANVGIGGDRKRPARGRFSETAAWVGGESVGYFAYALPTLPTGADPLRLRDDGKPYAPVPTPVAYVFDAEDGKPFPDRYACTPPAGYAFDPRRDEIDLGAQGTVFSELPSATYVEGAAPTTSYVPVVAEARVSSSGRACQYLKSEKQIDAAFRGKPAPTGNYLAFLIIDPGAPVYPKEVPTGIYPMDHPMFSMPHPGLGLQRWGWFGRYLLAYLDGGYIPTGEDDQMGGTASMPTTRKVLRMRPQRLFIPRQVRTGMTMAAGRPGSGYDVLEFKRGDVGYSPICQVWLYGDPMMPVEAAALPKDAATILGSMPMPAAQTPATYVYCLQVK